MSRIVLMMRSLMFASILIVCSGGALADDAATQEDKTTEEKTESEQLVAATMAESTASSPWQFQLRSSSRLDYYTNSGDENATIYTEEFFHGYNELDMQFNKKFSPYESFAGHVAGLFNDSSYRDSETGLLLENVNLSWEKGDTALPFRVEAGDYFGFYSLRSLQRGLKGVQFELQPKSSMEQSALLSVGTTSPRYDNFDFKNDYYAGASYTLKPSESTTLAFNAVYNDRAETVTQAATDQAVFSIVAEQQFALGSHELDLEAEAAQFNGDIAGIAATTKESDQGYFLQVRGRTKGPLDYRFRYEDYGQNFRPNGAVVSSDRRSAEAHAGWRFPAGIHIAGRLQNFRDANESANPFDTDTVGIRVTGPWFGGSTALDAFVQNRENEDNTTDSTTKSVTLNLAGSIGAGWNARMGLSTQMTEDNLTMTGNDTHQIVLGGNRRVRIGAFEGTINPNVTYRVRRGVNGDIDEIGPGIGLRLAHDRHDFQLNYSSLEQQAEDNAGRDNVNHTAGFRYNYTRDQHRFGLEANHQSRNPEGQIDSAGSHYGLTYTFSFDNPGYSSAALGQTVAGTPGAVDGVIDVYNFIPGSSLTDAQSQLQSAGIAGSSSQANAVVYETQLLDSIGQRQRLVLENRDGVVQRSALIISFDDIGDLADASRTYARVREVLLKRYGSPDVTMERGEFTANIVSDLRMGEFVRILEWRTPSGTLRFGVPERLDQQLRMELQHATGFPSINQSGWSLESVY